MSQFRRFLTFTWRNHLRAFKARRYLGQLGKRVFIDKDVEFMRFPKNIYIADFAVLKAGARLCSCNQNAVIRVGERTTIGYHSFIFASEQIEIGNDCLIAPFVYIIDSNHRYRKELRINQQDNETKPVKIGDDVWIASGVTILAGVTIGEGAVIAANSVVNRDILPYEIWGGSPAKKIGDRE